MFLCGRGVLDLEALIRGRDYGRSSVKRQLRIKQIQPETAESPGIVWYEILADGAHEMDTIQPFRRGAGPDRGHKLVWSAEGPDDALTLSPSFLCRYDWPGHPEKAEQVIVHLFLKDGKIELCGDSTVELAPA